MSREHFERIKNHFKEKDAAGLSKGRLPMRSTEKGFWGVSNLDDVYQFFQEKQFPKDATFIDLGCGDGRVTLVASLFVKASGLEWDEELIKEAQNAAQELNIDAKFHREDMRNHDLSEYDAIYMYADQRFDFLKHKLLEELNGALYLYHDTYHPDFLEKGKITWIGQIPIFEYTKK